MKKKAFALMLSMTMALSFLSGCGKKEEDNTSDGGSVGSLLENVGKEAKEASEGSGSEKMKDTEEKESKEKEADEDTKKSEQISWAVEPFLSVDDILVDDITGDSRVNMVAIVNNNEKFGYVRYDGTYALEPFFEGRTPDRFGMYNNKDSNDALVGDITESGELSIYPSGIGWGGPGYFAYYYDVNTMSIYQEFGACGPYTEDKVQVVNQIKSIEKTGDYFNVPETESKFGLANTKGLITELKYEDGYCNTDDGSPYVALKSGGKWGFFRINGEQLTDFLYEEFPGHEQDGNNNTRPNGITFEDVHDMPYLPTDGYIAVRKNGKCGYIDVDGKEIYPIGTFDDVRPVHGQKAWAKKDGKWGILEFPAGTDKKVEIKKEDYFKMDDTAEALEAYSDVVTEYKRGFEYLNANGKMEGFESKYGFTAFRESHQFDIQDSKPSYALYDINGDGTRELILEPGEWLTYDDIFTLVNGKPVHLGLGAESDDILGFGAGIDLHEGGHLLEYTYERYTEHSFTNVTVYKMSGDGSKWEVETYAYADITDWPENPVYTCHDADGNVITKDEYDAIFDKYANVQLTFSALP